MVEFPRISQIERLVDEVVIWDFELFPYAKMRIRVYEDQSGAYIGKCDIKLKDSSGDFQRICEKSDTSDNAFKKVVKVFYDLAEQKGLKSLSVEDIEYVDYYDF